jgi:hypothetical protein
MGVQHQSGVDYLVELRKMGGFEMENHPVDSWKTGREMVLSRERHNRVLHLSRCASDHRCIARPNPWEEAGNTH